MAKNDFKPFATVTGANVIAQPDYENLPALAAGFQSGKASSAQINKAIRQATVIASAVAQFIADTNNQDVLDDGDISGLQQLLLDALKTNAAYNIPQASTTSRGITQLSNATDSDNETVAATSKAVKLANDNANSRLPATGTAAAATKLATARTIGGIAFDGTANINLPGVNAVGNQATTGNAATATKLATARTIGGVSFDGTANINLPGVNAPGTQATTGNAATATKLATARTIGGVSFDGTANINLPGVNAAGTQATTGNAATATKLATSRTINGVAFDGTANITVPPADTSAICSSWVIFTADTTTPVIVDSHNVSSVTYVSTGVFEVNFAAALTNANYMINATTGRTSYSARFAQYDLSVKTANKLRINVYGISGASAPSESVSVLTFGGI